MKVHKQILEGLYNNRINEHISSIDIIPDMYVKFLIGVNRSIGTSMPRNSIWKVQSVNMTEDRCVLLGIQGFDKRFKGVNFIKLSDLVSYINEERVIIIPENGDWTVGEVTKDLLKEICTNLGIDPKRPVQILNTDAFYISLIGLDDKKQKDIESRVEKALKARGIFTFVEIVSDLLKIGK